MNQRTITHVVLPSVIFPSLFLIGCKYMYLDHFSTGLDKTINELCFPPSPLAPSSLNLTLSETKSYVRSYTYIPQLDFNEIGPCGVVAFFHLLLDAPATTEGLPQEFLTYLLGTGLPCVLVMLIEAHRYKGRQHWLLTWPTFWLLMSQTMTLGLTFPLWWLLLISSRSSSRSPRRDGIDTAEKEEPIASLISMKEVEGLALGLAFGAILPSIAMVVMKDPYATWLWQFYPVFVTLIRALYAKWVAPAASIRPNAGPPEKKEKNISGKDITHEESRTIRVIYLLTLFLSSYFHIRAVWPRIWRGDYTGLSNLLIVTPALPSETHPSLQALSFFKWDYTLSYSSLLLGILWSASSPRELVYMGAWFVVLSPLLGVGAASVYVHGVLIEL